jgi:Domain of Unknown Function with PDB structure (DUF3857)
MYNHSKYYETMLHRTLMISAFLLALDTLYAQNRAEKWGKIPAADLAMTLYPQDSSAKAVILQAVGSITVAPQGEKTLATHTHSRRIKVLDVAAFKEGNLSIPYYSYGNYEKMSDLDIMVYQTNGTEQKVKSDNIFTEKINKYWSAKKVFIPNLQKGCIIEYRYTLTSERIFSLYDWYFQDELPTRWSELTLMLPPYLEYVQLSRIHHMFDLKETENREATMPDGMRRLVYVNHYGLANLPAIREEPFITTLDDYRACIKFQLKAYNPQDGIPKQFMTSWTDVAKTLEKESGFGHQYLKNGQVKDLWEAFQPQITGNESTQVLAEKALRFVSSNIKWNEEYRIYSPAGLEKAFQNKTGSTADLNLAVVALLRKAGADAVPVLVSTRRHGEAYPTYPFMDQFNSVIALVRKDSLVWMMDATDPFHPLNHLRDQHYNQEGWVVDAQKPDWIPLSAPETGVNWYGRMALTEAGELTGRFSFSATGSQATDWRTALRDSDDKAMVKQIFSDLPDNTQFDSVVWTARDACDQVLKADFTCRIPEAAQAVNDFLYCKPVIDFLITENPLKSLRREFPVDLPHPIRGTYVLFLRLPPGYTVAEMPTGARISLPNNGGRVQFTCLQSEPGLLHITLKMNVAQTRFMPEEYDGLRQFFELAAEKVALQLVLKKS